MPKFTETPPTSLYIHLPWCVRKCPYCDFNSHEIKENLPEELYVAALLDDFARHLPLIAGRQLISIFFGGGTPSLFSPRAISKILHGIAQQIDFIPEIEITLEANPGTVDQAHFHDYRQAGINRISLGIQSLQNEKLKTLGRIHDRENAERAILIAKQAGFDNFNLDIMYGLPQQTLDDALADLRGALHFAPTHFSWYQLTLEPNTLFYHQKPVLPEDDHLWEMQIAGQEILATAGYQQYEVSAYAQSQKQCVHNRNYWEFGDYLGIGAGAHSKITCIKTGNVTRFAQIKHPRDYLESAKRHNPIVTTIADKDIAFEFMLNALRLTQGVSVALFESRTGLSIDYIADILNQAKQKKLLIDDLTHLSPTPHGKKFLNDLITMFL